jgi:hypothetical protein
LRNIGSCADLRVLLIWATSILALTAPASLVAVGDSELLVLRAIESFSEGTISVLMFVVVVTRLPPGSKRNIGLAVFGFASTAPSALAASAGAFVTEHWGWRGNYYFDIAWALVVLALAIGVIRPSPRAMRLSEIDWRGYALLAAGCAALIAFMKQGDRFFRLRNPNIVRAGLAAVLVPASLCVSALRRHPLLDLSLMRTSFGLAVTLATFYRFGMVMTAFVVPQTLALLQGFRIEQIADANIWMFWAECAAFPLAWFWASRWDARADVCGLTLICTRGFPQHATDSRLAGRRLPSDRDYHWSWPGPLPRADPVLRDARRKARTRPRGGGAVQSQSCRRAATANVALEQQQLLVVASREAVAKAQVDSSEVALLSAKFALDDTEVWSPIDGVVANLQTRVGAYVANDVGRADTRSLDRRQLPQNQNHPYEAWRSCAD